MRTENKEESKTESMRTRKQHNRREAQRRENGDNKNSNHHNAREEQKPKERKSLRDEKSGRKIRRRKEKNESRHEEKKMTWRSGRANRCYCGDHRDAEDKEAMVREGEGQKRGKAKKLKAENFMKNSVREVGRKKKSEIGSR